MNRSDERIAAVLAHEFKHAEESRLSNSVFEEVSAYKFEYDVSLELGIDPGYSARRAAGIDLEVSRRKLEPELRDIRNEWKSKKDDYPQYSMYANLPLYPVEGFWSELGNVCEMGWYLTFGYWFDWL